MVRTAVYNTTNARFEAQGSDTTATDVPSTASGGIAATDVEAAIDELDSEKAPKADPTFTGTTVTLADAQNVVVGSSSGTKIATATSQKLGFFNATPIVQPTTLTQTYSTADATHAARTATALTVTDGAGTNDGTIGAITDNASTIAAVQELAAAVNALIVDLADTAAFVNSAVDKLQSLGLLS